MAQIEFIPERRADGTIVLRAIALAPAERLRRLVRRLLAAQAGTPRGWTSTSSRSSTSRAWRTTGR